jgi:hypothetical protein
MVESNLDFGLLQTKETFQTADYKSAGSHQGEQLDFELVTDANQWEEVLVVPAGKTYYLTAVSMAMGDAGVARLGTGAAASETEFLVFIFTAQDTITMSFPTPVKFTENTRISAKTDSDFNSYFSLVGFTQ